MNNPPAGRSTSTFGPGRSFGNFAPTPSPLGASTPIRQVGSATGPGLGLGLQGLQGLQLDLDENAPPDPLAGDELELPPSRAMGMPSSTFGRPSATTPLNLSALRTPGAPYSPSVHSNAPLGTPRGSALNLGMSTNATPTGKGRVVFRMDPTLVSTFDPKTEKELHDLWAA